MKTNFISELADEKKLSEINFFGTHDSMTAFVDMENAARCQSLTMSAQLSLGVRLFDIRLSRKNNGFYLVHSLANCYTDESKKERMEFSFVLSECVSFLRENPQETIILSIKQDRGMQSKKFFPDFYEKYIKGNEELWYLKNEIPALSECRGKIVLMRRCKVRKSFDKNKGGLDFSFWKDQAKKRYEPLPVILNENQLATVQDRYCLPPEIKWKECAKPLLETFTADENTVGIHFLSTSSRYKGCGLEKSAQVVNSHFKDFKLRKSSGWFFFDFPDEEIAQKVINSNFD